MEQTIFQSKAFLKPFGIINVFGTFCLIMAMVLVYPINSFGQEVEPMDELKKGQEDLKQKVALHQSVLNGLSESLNNTKVNQTKIKGRLGSSEESVQQNAADISAFNQSISQMSADILQSNKKLDQLILEQRRMQTELEESVSKVRGAFTVAIVSSLITLILAWALVRSIVRKNKLNWYSLVRDTLSAE